MLHSMKDTASRTVDLEDIQNAIRKVFNIRLAAKELDSRALSSLTGLPLKRIYNILNHSDRAKGARRRIERVLGPIWMSEEEFARCERLTSILGFDPIEVPVPQLHARAMELGAVKKVAFMPREDILLAVDLHCAESMPVITVQNQQTPEPKAFETHPFIREALAPLRNISIAHLLPHLAAPVLPLPEASKSRPVKRPRKRSKKTHH